MGAEWLSAALPYIGGGVLGSAVTYGLTWVREHRRTLDAYRAPQRHAIGEILAAAHEFQLRLLEWRRVMSDLTEEMRADRTDNLPTISAELRQSESAYAVAMLNRTQRIRGRIVERSSTHTAGKQWWPLSPRSHGSRTRSTMDWS